MFAIAFDGFVQRERRMTFDEVKIEWSKAIMNPMLYQYSCSVYELDENGKTVRVVSRGELTD